MIALPFFLLLFAILETAMMLWTSEVLEEAVTNASRTLLTGDSHTRYASTDAAVNTKAFRDDICNYAPAFIECGKLKIDVRSYASFAGAAGGAPSGGTLDTSGFGYNQPLPGQIVVVRGALEFSPIFTKWSSAFAELGGGKFALLGSAAFRTEPYTAPTKAPST